MADITDRISISRAAATLAGGILATIGLVGFFSDPVLFIFEVNDAHNVVHLLTGALLVAAAYLDGGRNASPVLLVLGVVYALFAVLGMVRPALTDSLLFGTVIDPAVNNTGHALHLLFAVVFIGIPLVTRAKNPAAA